MIKQLFYGDSLQYRKFRDTILKDNLRRIKMFSFVIMVLELMFLILSFVFKDLYPQQLLLSYRYHYTFLFVGSLGILLLTTTYKEETDKRLFYEVMVYIITIVLLLWGSSITLLDLSNSNTTTVYLTFIFILSVAVVVRPDLYFFILLATQIMFMMRLPGGITMNPLQINSSVFVLFAWFVSRYQFFTVYEKHKHELMIQDKNDVLEKQNNELVRLMMTDHLTGMYNRYSLDDILSKKWIEAYVHKSFITVLMIDIDLFKNFNDTHGHIIGDHCLQEVSNVLSEISNRYEGYGFRYGGDEFCLIISGLRYKEVLIDEILRKISQVEINVGDRKVSIGLSIGAFHEIPKESSNEWQCIDYADKDLYVQKSKRKRRATDEPIEK